MTTPKPRRSRLRKQTREFYQRTLELLTGAGIPFLVGGGYAFTRYTGIQRPAKDFDLFLRREHCERALEMFAAQGFRTELRFPHWLGKVWNDRDLVDLVFSSGNGIAIVDDEWFEHARPDRVFGVPVELCPPEEMIWSKAFIMERERYDGADVAHLILSCAGEVDWRRLLRRFEQHWEVLLSHLLLFRFSYPAERARIPDGVLDALLERLRAERASEFDGQPVSPSPLCQGTLISREQFLVDVEDWGYRDARLEPEGTLTKQDVERWTADIKP